MSTVTLKAKLKVKKTQLISLFMSLMFAEHWTVNGAVHGRKPHRKLLLMTTVYLLFEKKKYLNTSQPYWKYVFWIAGHNKGATYQHENIIPKIKSSPGNIMMPVGLDSSPLMRRKCKCEWPS